jgi:hypothetical protein
MPVYEPYGDGPGSALYNLLFAEDPTAFAALAGSGGERLAPLFADAVDEDAIAAIVSDEGVESRLRAIGYLRLRKAGLAVPKGVLLGVIIEMPLEGGLDTLAAYVDRRVRYINQKGGVSIVEDRAPSLQAPLDALLHAAQTTVHRIGPWEGERLAPPKLGNVRLSFLVSDGLYFGEGRVEAIASDPLGGAVLHAGGQLLAAVVDLALANKP